MEYKELGSICNIVSGGTPSRANAEFWDSGTIPWIKISDIKSKYVSQADEYITQAGLDGSSAKIINAGSILYTIFATLGEVGILTFDACTNQAIAALTIKEPNEVLTDYLYYYLKAKKEYINSLGRGVAQNNINLSILRKLRIPIIGQQQQQRIVSILTICESILERYKLQLAKLNDLIKARFVEMFGDCATHEELGNLSILITKGSSPRWQGVDYTESGVLFITSENVREGYIDYSKRKYLDERINNIQPRSILKKDDILINIVGASIGRAAVFTENISANINQAVALVRLKPNCIDLTYLITYLNSGQAMKAYKAMKKGGARDNLSLENISSLQIPLAPYSSQVNFSSFATQVEKSKTAVQSALDRAQLLFDSLMQKYFG